MWALLDGTTRCNKKMHGIWMNIYYMIYIYIYTIYTIVICIICIYLYDIGIDL